MTLHKYARKVGNLLLVWKLLCFHGRYHVGLLAPSGQRYVALGGVPLRRLHVEHGASWCRVKIGLTCRGWACQRRNLM